MIKTKYMTSRFKSYHHTYERLCFLALAELSSPNQCRYRNRNQGSINDEIRVRSLQDNKENLKLTSKHKEEIEFQERNINLERSVS
jgi:hypothetical protein